VLVDRANQIARSGHPELLGVLRFHNGTLAFTTGNLVQACTLVEPECLLQDDGHQSITSQGFDHRGGLFNVLAWSKSLQGDSRAAKWAIAKQLTVARASNHPLTIAFAEAWGAPVLELLGETDQSLALIDSAHALATKHALPQLLWWSAAVKGWLLARRGQIESGVEMLRTTIDSQRATGMMAWLPWELAWLSEALLIADRVDEAVMTAAEGLQICETTGLAGYQPELYRLLGETFAAQSSDPAARRRAETAFRDGISLARSQTARLLEVRATVGLCRLLSAERRIDEAVSELTLACSGGAHEAEFPDLGAARALLRELHTDPLGTEGTECSDS
jgi:hypothetical protein